MARSTYVYVLSQYGQSFGAFTVKHELISAANRFIPVHLRSEYVVTRYYDGHIHDLTPPIIMGLTQFMEK